MTASVLAGGLLLSPVPSTAAPARAAAPAAALGTGDQTLDVLVLGDSYSAGNGATDDQGAAQTYGPAGCERSKVNWSEKYAAALRATGQAVRLVDHACSGAVTADFTAPRVMDTATKAVATPAGVTTTAQADAYLAQTDPCNTRAFPDEEFWTYQATNVTPLGTTYTCTRNLRPQTDFVTPDTDLVLFTMGGNDAGFSSIVGSCFFALTRTAAACKTSVDAARALLPQIGPRLQAGIAAMRAHGLREDAKLVQLGYPLLQTDDNFTLPGSPSYDAGNQIRAFGTEGNAASSAIVPAVNSGHPGQLTFLTGVPEKFAGHEPDAATAVGNPARWLNQIEATLPQNVWYHPNRLGQIAYSELLTARGTFGATTGPAVAPTPVTAKVEARFTPRRTHPGDRVRLKVRVTLSDGSRPHGKVVVRGVAGRTLTTTRLRGKDRGTVVLTFRVPERRTGKVHVIYRDRVAPTVRLGHPVTRRGR